MGKTGDSIASRLQQWRDQFEDVTECAPVLLPSLFHCDKDAKYSRALLKAAAYFKLDPSKEADLYVLLQILAEVVFPDRGRQSGTAGWGARRLNDLGRHWREVERANPGISDSRAAKEIKERYPQKYQSAAAIRPRLPDARIMFGVKETPDGGTRTEGQGKSLRPKVLAFRAKLLRITRYNEIMLGELGNKKLSREQRRSAWKTLSFSIPRLEKISDNFFEGMNEIIDPAKAEAKRRSNGPRARKVRPVK
jgi:hypothetical protein